jgi:hypothetical protein
VQNSHFVDTQPPQLKLADDVVGAAVSASANCLPRYRSLAISRHSRIKVPRYQVLETLKTATVCW